MSPDADVDAVMLTLKTLYDQYGLCAGRMWQLLDWLDQPQETQ